MMVGPSFVRGLAAPLLFLPLVLSVGGSAIAALGATHSCFLGRPPAARQGRLPERSALQPFMLALQWTTC